MDTYLKDYELSIWDLYPDEKKVCVIGWNDSEIKSHAKDLVLTKNVNGNITLKFTMYTRYYNELTNEFEDNLFIDLLPVEACVKLKYDGEWYDFVITNRQENSEQKTYTYTAKSLHIQELAKNGFNLEFNAELGNNIGTIQELSKKIVEGTEWIIDESGSDTIRSYQDDQLLIVTTKQQTAANEVLSPNSTVNIGSEKKLYAFYTDYTAATATDEDDNTAAAANVSDKIQCFYSDKFDNLAVNDLDKLIYEGNYYTQDGIIDRSIGFNVFVSKSDLKLDDGYTVSQFKGERLQKADTIVYEKALDRYVTKYKKDGETDENASIRGYVKTEFLTPDYVQELIVNGKEFVNNSGWYPMPKENQTNEAELPAPSYGFAAPALDPSIQEYSSFLKFGKGLYYNTAFRSNASKIGGIAQGAEFVVECNLSSEYTIKIYHYDGTEWTELETEIDIDNNPNNGGNDAKHIITFKTSYSEKEVKNLRFCLEIANNDTQLNNISFFRKYDKTNTTNTTDYYLPGEVPPAQQKEKYFYYTAADVENNNWTTPEDFKYLYEGYVKSDDYTAVTNEYNKVTSIEKKESNRFNLIQELCEKFKCWACFEIAHESDGRIADNGRKIKFKEFVGDVKYSGFRNGVNLKSIQRTIDSDQISTKIIVKPNKNQHGVDGYSSIHRAKNNPIKQSYILNFDYYIQKEILNKEQVHKDLYGDKGNNIKGFYETMRAKTNERDDILKRLAEDQANYLKGMPMLKAAEEMEISCEQNLARLKEEYQTYCGLEYPILPLNDASYTQEYKTYLSNIAKKGQLKIQISAKETAKKIFPRNENWQAKKNAEITALNKELATVQAAIDKVGDTYTNMANAIADPKLKDYFNQIARTESLLSKAIEDKEVYKDFTEENYNTLVETANENVKNLEISTLENSFFKKYQNYIKEGSWTSEDYFDDDLYYIDALDVARTSSKPKVTYTINVIDVSPLPGFESFKVNVGDKTFVEDVEFFGTVPFVLNGATVLEKPYQEEVVVIETVEYLSSPEKNTIKVQNYKTQFDDLFQRITASQQQLQYASGGYNRASAAFNDDGTIDGDILQDSMSKYPIYLQGKVNDSILWNEEGIQIFSREKPSDIIRLSQGKISLSNNGGSSWNTAIDANGINASMITTGVINTEEVLIGNQDKFNFRWDRDGLDAYTTGTDGAINYGKFVRFDQYGVYGYDGSERFVPAEIGAIKNNEHSLFGLTWEGFFLKSKHKTTSGNYDLDDKGRIDIDIQEDFRVIGSDGTSEVIKIGLLQTKEENGIKNYDYGIRMKNLKGETVFNTNSNGDLIITGNITATGGKIGGWTIENNRLSSTPIDNGNGSDGIYLDGQNSAMYSYRYKDSLHMDGWKIDNDEAVFNNITLRGALKCAVLEYGEVQAVGGILMIRPSTAIKKNIGLFANNSTNKPVLYKKMIEGILTIGTTEYIICGSINYDGETDVAASLSIEKYKTESSAAWITGPIEIGGTTIERIESYMTNKDFVMETANSSYELANFNFVDRALVLQVENPDLFRNGDWIKLTTEADGNIIQKDSNNNVLLYSGINTNLFECLGIYYIEDKEEDSSVPGQKLKRPVVLLRIPESTNTDNLLSLGLEGMGLVDLGKPGRSDKDGSIAIALNSSTNEAMVPQTSLSVLTLEQSASDIEFVFSTEEQFQYEYNILGSDMEQKYILIGDKCYYVQSGGFLYEHEQYKYFQPHILLGKIPNDDSIYGDLSGKYGLYADAAYIKGTIEADSLVLGSNVSIEQAKINGLTGRLDGIDGQIDNANGNIGSIQEQLGRGEILQVDSDGKLIGAFAPGNITVSEKDINNNRTVTVDGINYIVSASGLIIADNMVTKGTVIATNGLIGGWKITDRSLKKGNTIWLSPEGEPTTFNNTTISNAVLKVGDKFCVDADGSLYATGAQVSGSITVGIENVTGLNDSLSGLQTNIDNAQSTADTAKSTAERAQARENLLFASKPLAEEFAADNSDDHVDTLRRYQKFLPPQNSRNYGSSPSTGDQPIRLAWSNPKGVDIEIKKGFNTTPQGLNLEDFFYTSWVDINPGATYIFSFDAFSIDNTNSNTGTSVDVYIGYSSEKKQYNANASISDPNLHKGGTTLPNRDWRTISYRFTVPAATATERKVSCCFRIDNDHGGADKKLYITNLKLELTTSDYPTVYVPAANDPYILGYVGVLQVDSDGKLMHAFAPNVEVGSVENGKRNVTLDGKTYLVPAAGLVIADNMVTKGTVIASTGLIGGWSIAEGKLYTTGDNNKVCAVQAPSHGTTWVFAAGGTTHSSYENCPFRVDKDGNLHATSANITGVITATSGYIGSWRLSTNYLQSTSGNVGIGTGANSGDWAFWAGYDSATEVAAFQVKFNGSLKATNATITGTITANAGTIGGWIIGSTGTNNANKYLKSSDGNYFITTTAISTAPTYKYDNADSTVSAILKISNAFVVSNTGSLYCASTNTQSIYTYGLSVKTWLNNGYRVHIGTEKNSDGTFVWDALSFETTTKTTGTSAAANASLYFYRDFNNKRYFVISYRRGNNETDCGMQINSTNDINITADQNFTIYRGNTLKLQIGNVNNQLLGKLFGTWKSSSAIANDSDLRKKNTINLLDSSYSIFFDKLQPVTYKYNNGTSDRLHTGFIAQDVQQALAESNISTQDFAGFVSIPEAVIDPNTGEETTVDMYSLRYEEFIALNTSEIQKLKKRVAELEQQLQTLQNSN